jgi:hypothetical protein
MTERALKVMDAFYSTFADKRQDFIVQKLNNDAIANVLFQVVNQLQYYNVHPGEDMILDAREIYDLCEELENL